MEYKLWHGNDNKYIDEIHIEAFYDMTIGLYGGYNAVKNEDGYLVMAMEDGSKFSVLFDAHTTNESVVYVIETLEKKLNDIHKICCLPINQCFERLQSYLLDILTSDEMTHELQKRQGETAVLFCFQKDQFIWWLSIGDNSLYVFHKEFNELGQYRLNQRTFYQWIGKQNALNLQVPCYTSGTLQLREGDNRILMLTDGVLEIEERPFENDKTLETAFRGSLYEGTKTVLEEVRTRKGKDNATMMTWTVRCDHQPLRPSRSKGVSNG